MARDEILTMSNRQSLAITVSADMTPVASTRTTGTAITPVGEPAGAADTYSLLTPASGLIWHLMFIENTSTPIIVQGNMQAELQYSIDGAAGTYLTAEGTEVSFDDAELIASGVLRIAINVGRNFRDLGVTDFTQISFRTFYSTDNRACGDGVAVVAATSYLSTPGSYSGD